MTFKEWLFSSYDNIEIDGRWGTLHIIVLLLCIMTIITLSLIFRKRSEKARNIVLWVLAGLIFIFEITRRIINLIKTPEFILNDFLHTILPRPWCAISCWLIIISIFVRKKWFYNFTTMSALLCAIIFFAYPGTGFNNTYMLFENVYSISTHALLLITSITLITLKFTDFRYKTIWKEAIMYLSILTYAFIEIFVLKIENDPLYFMPGNEIQDIFASIFNGFQYWHFLIVYIIFSLIYFNSFYLINDRKTVFRKRIKIKN